MRLAWFSPWPPDRSGVAGRSADVVPRLAARGHAIDVFVDERRVAVTPGRGGAGPNPGEVRILGAHEFVWRMGRGQYDLPVYQVGNSRLHEYIWPYLFRWSGLGVLHDARIHHARARTHLARRNAAAYRAEFIWSHPSVAPEAAELAIAGFSGMYYYQWPMLRGVLEASRLVATHAHDPIDPADLTDASAPLEYIALGEGETTREAAAPASRAARRAGAGLAPDTVVFGVFGALTSHRRLDPIMRAFASVHAHVADTRLVLVGTVDPALRLSARLAELGIQDATLVSESPDDDTFDGWIAAVDVSLNLRWPTSREVSGPWLRALAAARATIVIDLEHLARLPTLDPRTGHRHAPADRRAADRAIAVAIDILDEEHSLRRAMLWLANDPDLRDSLGRAGCEYWERHHTLGHMVADYERVIARAATLAPRQAQLPEALRPAASAPTHALLAPFGPEIADRAGTLEAPAASA